jgi:outer membrane receptor protein involved in Fe transport
VWTFAPRLGITYPISPRDAFSLAYVRIHQVPGRDFLYDQRTAIGDRQPLGNPAIGPSALISYEAAVKHVFSPAWALQAAVFHRDVFGQVGALDAAIPEGPVNLRYSDQDESHALGFEASLIHADSDRRLEAHYVWMTAYGNESRPEGDPYGPVRAGNLPPITDQALSWDRRHTVLLSGFWPWRRTWSLAWSTALQSALPWTPKPRRAPLTDLGLVNSRRLSWTENTNLGVGWSPRNFLNLGFGLEVRNLFDHRGEKAATLDGYPNPAINTLYDDYGAYRTETGLGGGAYWSRLTGGWIPVHDPRLVLPPRSVRASISSRW